MSKPINPNDKGYTRRTTNQLAGARIALPGHNHMREGNLRAELIADFKPTNVPEKIWVGDLAHCLAAAEVKRAQIAGFYQVKLRYRARDILAPNPMHDPAKPDSPPAFNDDDIYSESDRDCIENYASCDFEPPWPHTLLGKQQFALLLGSLSASDMAQLRQLELALHELMRERDRIIRQMDRRRQQAMRDAILMAEERRRARAAGEVEDEAAGATVDVAADLEDDGLAADENGDDEECDLSEEFSSDDESDADAEEEQEVSAAIPIPAERSL